MSTSKEDETYRKLKQADFQFVMLQWMSWLSEPKPKLEDNFSNILKRHGWTDREFAEQIKRRYYKK